MKGSKWGEGDYSGWSGAQLDGRCVCLCYLPLHHKSPEEDFFWHRLTGVVPEKGL